MREWQRRELREISEVRMGQSPPGSLVHELHDGLPFLQGNAEFGAVSPEPKFECDLAPRRAAVGDVLISVRAPVGAINRADAAYGIGRGLAAVRFSDVDERFGAHALAQAAPNLQRVSQGTTFAAVRRAELGSLIIGVPPLEEQRRIAEILDAINEAIHSTECVVAKLGLTLEGLVRDLVPAGRLAPLAADETLPPGWRFCSIDELATSHDGRRVPIRTEDRLRRKGPFRYYGASGVIDHIDAYLFDGEYVLLGEDGQNVLYRTGPLSFLVRGRFWVNNHAHVMEAKPGVAPRFLQTVLERTDYTAVINGSDQKKLTQAGLRAMRFPIAAEHLQVRLCDQLDAMRERIGSERNTLLALRNVREGLARDLLSGRVRTAVP